MPRVSVVAHVSLLASVLSLGACAFSGRDGAGESVEVARAQQRLIAPRAWSESPPVGLLPAEVPQFVAVTFDDNFISGLGDTKGGMTWVTTMLRDKVNPAGNGTVGTFDGSKVRTTFFFTSLYIQTDEGNRTAWRTAVTDGHEAADHTVNHPNGTEFAADNWQTEIGNCRNDLSSPDIGVGVMAADVIGFRSPYLAYNETLTPVLAQNAFHYDSSVSSCWQDTESATNCAWPYTLDSGSPDADVVKTKFARPTLSPAAGVWEMPMTALVVPADDVAPQYGITVGLRDRIPPDMPLPSFYEKSSGKIAPLDITLFVDAGLTPAEVLGVLKYNLDLHLKGNRSPFVFVSHSHVYADNYTAAAHALDVTERQNAIEQFIIYALSKPEVRMRPLRDLEAWLDTPVPLTGMRLPVTAGGAGGASGSGGVAGSAGAVAGSGGMGAVLVAGAGGSAGVAGSSTGGTSPGFIDSAPASTTCSLSVARSHSRSPLMLWSLSLVALALGARRRRHD